MADKTLIEWTDASWNPITGCTLVSEGCRHCYAARIAATRMQHHWSREGLARLNADGEAKFTGEVRFNAEWLTQPLKWRKPRLIFVCAHGDLFHENVPDAWIDQVFAVMALSPQHTFQVLTKRPERAREYFNGGPGLGWGERNRRVTAVARDMAIAKLPAHWTALGSDRKTRIWFGSSAEDQETYDARMDALLDVGNWLGTTYLSAEPMLGPINLRFSRDHCDLCGGTGILGRWPKGTCHVCGGKGSMVINGRPSRNSYRRLDWVIVGGESGPGARPMHPDWARSLRDQCAAAGTAFFFKQWGAWADCTELADGSGRLPNCAEEVIITPDNVMLGVGVNMGGRREGSVEPDWDSKGGAWMCRIGKKAAGRRLDGIEHNAMPEAQ